MKTLDQLRAEQSAELAKLTREHSIANALPIPCDSVMLTATGCPWVTYKRTTLGEAIEVMRAFTVVPMDRWNDGSCTTVMPEVVMSTRESARYHHVSGPHACEIRTHQGDRFGPDAELVFYAQTNAEIGIVRVSVKIGSGYIGACPQLSASVQTEKDKKGRTIARRFVANVECRSLSDDLISWASGDSGPIKTAAQFSYLFCADQSEPMSGADQSHAIGQLQCLIDRTGV